MSTGLSGRENNGFYPSLTSHTPDPKVFILLDLTLTCAAQVLGYPLLYSPSDHGRNTLAAEILKCNDSKNGHELLGGLAHVYGVRPHQSLSSTINWILSAVLSTSNSL